MAEQKEKIKIEDVLKTVVKADRFSELEGWNDKLIESLGKFMRGCLMNSHERKPTIAILLAWQDLENGERAILEEHIGQSNMVHVGVLITSMFGFKMSAIRLPSELGKLLKELLEPKEGD